MHDRNEIFTHKLAESADQMHDFLMNEDGSSA